jgi:putative endonuclease
MGGHVYILASRRYGTLYTGMTSDLARRIGEHREGLIPGFTRDYAIKRLVFVESHDDINEAIVREKRIKEWKRDWKINLIERDNPLWDDLAVSLLGFAPLPLNPARHPGEGGDP